VRADVRAWRTGLRPGPVGYRRSEVLRGGLGALTGIALAAVTAHAVPGGPAGLPWIVAPMGATAVLLFAAPASPLAQPYPVVVGNTLSTLVGVAAGRLVDDVTLAAAVAVGVAIPLMMVLRCVHPPGGACALFTAVGGAAVTEHGWAFALWPVGVDTVVLLLVAALVNNLTGRTCPSRRGPLPRRRPPSGSGCRPRTSGRRCSGWTAAWTCCPATSWRSSATPRRTPWTAGSGSCGWGR
jgi:CBS domain-containing membrane protein